MKQKKVRVLIVDDEINFSSVVSEELTNEGFYVEQVSDGKDALKLLQQGEYDVVLLDINMPQLSGIDVLKKFQRDDLPPEFIMITGYASVQTAIEAMKLGAYDYITKPYRIEKLKTLIEKAWDKRRIRRENIILRTKLKEDDMVIDTKSPLLLEILEAARKLH